MATPDIDVVKYLRRINGKFQIPFGIVIWATDAAGNPVRVLCQPNGALIIAGVVAVVGPVDVSDRAARLLGIIYGSQGQQLQQRAATFDTLVQLRSAGVEIDPRDVTDRAARLLGVVYGSQAQQLLQRAATFDLMVQLRSAGVEIDPRDITDRAARLLGVVYGSQATQLLQRAATFDLIVQLRSAGVEIDPRVIINDMATGQSTTVPLAGGATYTSGTMTGDGYRRITGSVTANVAGTLYVEQSPNGGVNWDISDAITVGAGEAKGFCVEVCCPSLRIRYVNGAAAQATFRLYSFLRTI